MVVVGSNSGTAAESAIVLMVLRPAHTMVAQVFLATTPD